jgi:4,5-DOPA dioxygenase extradiol
MGRGTDATPPTVVERVRPVGAEALAEHDFDALLDFGHKAPAARLAHPRTEHFAPLFVTLGASLDRHGRAHGHRRLLVRPGETVRAVQLS